MNRLRLLVCGLVLSLFATPVNAQDIEKIFSKDIDTVISINIRGVLDSALVKKNALESIQNAIKANEEAQKAFSALGLDPLKDVERISFGMVGFDINDAKAIIVVGGKFDAKKIDTTLTAVAKDKPKEVSLDKIGTKSVFKLTSTNMPNPVFGTVVDEKTLVLSTSKEMLSNAIDGAMGVRKPEITKELTSLLKLLDSKSAISMVTGVQGKLDALPINDPATKKLLDAAESLSLNLRVSDDLSLEIAMGMSSAEKAKEMNLKLEEGLKLAKALLPTLANQNAQLQPIIPVVNGIKQSTKEKSVILSTVMTEADILKLINPAK